MSATLIPKRAAILRSIVRSRFGWPKSRNSLTSCMPGMAAITEATSSPFCSSTLRSLPKILSARDPLVPVIDSPTLSSIGCEKFQTAPGYFCTARFMAAISSSLFLWKIGRHWSCGFKSTKYSVFPKPPVSVPSSGRPACDTTVFTSGNDAKTRRSCSVNFSPSERLVLLASVPRAQMAPSSRCGRNSDPMAPLNPR